MLKLHEQVKLNIIKANERYSKKANKKIQQRELQEGDLVWIHIRKDRFPKYRQNKLLPRAAGPFKVLKKIGDNAYKIDLPYTYGVSNTFNIGDLSKYEGSNELGTIQLEEGGDDPYLDHEDNPQAETNQEAKTYQPTEPKSMDLHSDLNKEMATDLIKAATQEDQLQSRPKSSIKEQLRQEESRKSPITTNKQSSSPRPCQ